MATGSFTHYGFLIDPISSTALLMPFVTDLDMGGHSISNASLISGDQLVINNDATIGGCLSGPTNTPINLCEGAIIGKALEMPQNEIAISTNLFNFTTINDSGPPLSSPAAGSAAFTTTDKILWIYDGSTWEKVGSVTSVDLSVPSEFTLSGNPITSSGTITISKATQISNLVYASPDGVGGVPTFRALTANDLPPSSDPLSVILSNGNTTSGSSIEVSNGDNVEFTGGQIVYKDGLKDTNSNVVLKVLPQSGGQTSYFEIMSENTAGPTFKVNGSNTNLDANYEAKGTGNFNLYVNAGSSVKTTGYFSSAKQSGACVQIRFGTDAVQDIGSTTAANLVFTHTAYDFYPLGSTTFIGTNKFLLKPSTAYTASFSFRATDPLSHTNNVDLVLNLNLYDGSGTTVLTRDTIYYPNTKNQAEGNCSVTFFTNSSATQELTFNVNNTSNNTLRIVEWIGFVTKLN